MFEAWLWKNWGSVYARPAGRREEILKLGLLRLPFSISCRISTG